jgi:hypothetical protein
MVYMLAYLVMNLGAFLAVIVVERFTGSPSIFEFRGLGHRAPLAAVSMAIFLFALTGLPPSIGFTGKYWLFVAVIERISGPGGTWYAVLALIAALNTAVSLYYYARILRAMFFEAPLTETPVTYPLSYAVVVGARRAHQPGPVGGLPVPGSLLGRLVRVVRLDAVESHGPQPGQLPGIDPRDPGVGKRRHPTGTSDELDGVLGEQPVSPDVGWPPLPQVAVEGLLDRAHLAGLEEGPGHVWAPDGLASAAGDDGRLGHANPLLCQEFHDLMDAGSPVVGEEVLEIPQGGVHRVDEVAEDVDLPIVEQGRELDPGHESDAQAPGGNSARLQSGQRVVVGERPGPRSCRCRPRCDLGRRILSVGCSRMSVQVDDRVVPNHPMFSLP